jgi:BON domain
MTERDTGAAVQRLLAEAPQVAEQSVECRVDEGGLLLSGQVESAQRRDAIVALVREHFPELPVRAEIEVLACEPPGAPEVVS